MLLGNGDGTFGVLKNPIAVGNQPSAIATGTFNLKNSDSNTGFVVTNFKDNSYSVFNGNGDGTFTQVTGSPFLLPNDVTNPIALTVADFNSDGFPDLAIVDQGTNQVTILQGVGDGTFKEFPNSPIAVGKLPVAIANGTLSGSTGPGPRRRQPAGQFPDHPPRQRRRHFSAGSRFASGHQHEPERRGDWKFCSGRPTAVSPSLTPAPELSRFTSILAPACWRQLSRERESILSPSSPALFPAALSQTSW